MHPKAIRLCAYILLNIFLLTGSLGTHGGEHGKIVTEIPVYTKGTGGKYQLKKGGDQSDIEIFFVESSKTSLVTEMQLNSTSDNLGAMGNMTQQFHFKLAGGSLQLIKGIFKLPGESKPLLVPQQVLSGLGGLNMKDFLIGSESDLKGLNSKEVQLVVGGKSYKAQHYTKKDQGRELDFWISDEAKPLGLLQLKSKGSAADENYTLTFVSSLSGRQATINAQNAVEGGAMMELFGDLLKNMNDKK